MLGAYGADPGGRTDAGTAYIIWGQASGLSAAFNLTTLNGSNGFKVEGLAAGDYLGSSVSTAGDLNGDGKADLVLGADHADPGGRTDAGTAYIIFGQASGFPAAFNLTTLDGSNGFKVEGLAADDRLGVSVSTAGDLNGDGKADLVLGAYGADPGGRTSAGIAYVLYGINASQSVSPLPPTPSQSASPSAISSIVPAPTPVAPITSPSAIAPLLISSQIPSSGMAPTPYDNPIFSSPSKMPPALEAQTLGIALGVSGVVLLGGLVVVLVVFKQKKMACFSNEPNRRRDSVQSITLKGYA